MALKLYYNIFILAFFLLIFKKNISNIIILLKYLKDNIKLVYINNYKNHNYYILTDFLVDYKKQVLIISIKINI